MFKIKVICFLLVFLTVAPQYASAQQGPDAFFRPVSSRDLSAVLPPRLNQDRLLSNNDDSNFLSFPGGGCPNEINIGSITDGSSVFGSTDIDVFIDGGIVIQCGQ